MSDTDLSVVDDPMTLQKPANDLQTLLERANQARAENDPARANVLYTRATEVDPNSANAWRGRAETAVSLDDAIASWACTLALAPGDQTARDALDQKVIEKEATSDPTQVQSLIELGKTVGQLGQKPWAYRLFRRATELEDTNEEAWVWRAGLADDRKEMISSLNQVLALNPDNARAKTGLEWASALETDKPAPPTTTEQAARLVEQGQELLEKGDKPRAHELFVQAAELDQRNEQAWLWRGSTTANVDEALTCMEQALAINPENESAREARSWLRVKKLRESAQAPVSEQTPEPQVVASVPADEPQKQRKTARLLLLLLLILILLALSAALVIRMF